MITSVDQTVDGKKIFQNIEVANPSGNANAVNKSYVDSEINKIKNQSVDTSNLVKKSGGTMTGALIIPKDNYPYKEMRKKLSVMNHQERYIFVTKKIPRWNRV